MIEVSRLRGDGWGGGSQEEGHCAVLPTLESASQTAWRTPPLLKEVELTGSAEGDGRERLRG